MKFSKTLIVSFLLLVTAMVSYYLYSPNTDQHNRESVHYHAGFRVYIDGTLQDYSDYKYMNFVPCSEHDAKKSPAEEQIEKAHLHDGVGDVVHTHRSGATWGDLFKNIGVSLPQDKMATLYINGELVSDMYNQPIGAYETAIFVFGTDNTSHVEERVPIDHIKEVEAKSELCGKSE